MINATKKVNLFLSFFAFLVVLNAANIDRQIGTTTTGISDTIRKEKALQSRLEKLGVEVNRYNRQIAALDNQIATSSAAIKRNENLVKKRMGDLDMLDKQLFKFESERIEIERELVKYLSEELALMILLDEFSLGSEEDMIQEDIFRHLSADSKKKIEELSKQQDKVVTQIQEAEKSITSVKEFIEQENQKQVKLDEAKKRHKETLIALKSELKAYNTELSSVLNEREKLQNLLQELNIKKEEEEDKKAREKEKAIVAEKMKSMPKIDVRQVSTAYHNVKTTKYTGKKTIAPLDKYRIEQKFGQYQDPIYNMKIFNESVTFVPLQKNAIVKSILDGEVIYAKESPFLKKVVIIKHSNNLHIAYAQLDKIAPNIAVGRKVPKGYGIGSVDNKLMLEVTQKNFHIDPLELISIK
ncbi:hypothetical protein CCZ01_02320 [Helicobacter monodelphidis]|uniref:murein hydrolase activator EnvC family protein n=1 Tax=Helicobacter sp. 15-1451 TaxID=2004995 RepID=UPI000DCD8D3C|nr:peptidoglycan DD-metalloendopeptidase family protein [Helicobacter sp. 15-1451]RAX58638.1 hypothetical protein CCZ01_02320 [Helicobacter sp. 15-1451]